MWLLGCDFDITQPKSIELVVSVIVGKLRGKVWCLPWFQHGVCWEIDGTRVVMSLGLFSRINEHCPATKMTLPLHNMYAIFSIGLINSGKIQHIGFKSLNLALFSIPKFIFTCRPITSLLLFDDCHIAAMCTMENTSVLVQELTGRRELTGQEAYQTAKQLLSWQRTWLEDKTGWQENLLLPSGEALLDRLSSIYGIPFIGQITS